MTASACLKETPNPKWKLEVASWNTGGPLKIYLCKYSFEIKVICRIHCTCNNRWLQVLFWSRYINTSLEKRGWLEQFFRLNTVTFKEKMLFEQHFLLGSPPIFIAFVSQSIAKASIYNFCVYKLIRLELFPT